MESDKLCQRFLMWRNPYRTTNMLNDFRNAETQPNNNDQRDEPFFIDGSCLTDDEDLKFVF